MLLGGHDQCLYERQDKATLTCCCRWTWWCCCRCYADEWPWSVSLRKTGQSYTNLLLSLNVMMLLSLLCCWVAMIIWNREPSISSPSTTSRPRKNQWRLCSLKVRKLQPLNKPCKIHCTFSTLNVGFFCTLLYIYVCFYVFSFSFIRMYHLKYNSKCIIILKTLFWIHNIKLLDTILSSFSSLKVDLVVTDSYCFYIFKTKSYVL